MDIFTYKMIYFMLALFLGFFVGYMLKKDNYEKNVQNEVFEMEKEFQESNKNLELTKEKFLESENRLQINRDLHQTQKNVIDKTKNEIYNLKQKTISSQDGLNELNNKAKNIQEDIAEYEKKIENIKPDYKMIAETIKENDDMNIKQELLQSDLKKLEEQINSYKTHISELKNTFANLKNLNEEYKSREENLTAKINHIKDRSSISETQDEEKLLEMADALKVKVLNYKYKLEELEKNIQNGISINHDDVQNFISKNENERFVDKFVSKIFNFHKKEDK
jgi:chromosome segregation ATPase